MPEDNLSKAELALIDRIITTVGLAKFRNTLWQKVHQAFGFSFHGTNIEYGFARATPDERSLKYIEDRIFILSDKTQAKLVGDLRWELLEGMKNSESIDQIKRRLDGIFEGNTVNTERIARTETLNAMNAGRQSAYEESGIVHYKMWKAAIGNVRTAADSKRLNGQIQEVGNPFIDPKTGDAFMHPPNRPNCRCAMIPMRKLPENIVHKGGQMYAADEMVGKIEIDIGSLSKAEKLIWVKPTSKRVGHCRKIKGAKEIEVSKSSIERIKAIIPNVHLDGATESQLESIANGVEETIGKFPDVKVEIIRWLTPDDEYKYGNCDAVYAPSHGLDPARIILSKAVIMDVKSWDQDANKKFTMRKSKNIDYFHRMIKGYSNWDENEKKLEYEEKLKNADICSRQFVAHSGDDKVKGIMVHECYHAIAHQLGGEEIFSVKLKVMKVTKYEEMQVSDYAASNDMELWAEAGSAIHFGLEIPDSVKTAFENTMEAIR